MNFFAAFNDIVSPEVVGKAAMYVEESTPKTQKAMESLGLTLLGGLMKRTTSEIGVNQLFNYIRKGDYDGSMTASLGMVLKDAAQTHTLINTGNDTVSHLLPAMKSSISNMISSYAGIRNSSAVSLLGLTTSIVLDILGKQVRDNKMDADALAVALFEQRDEFVQKVPDTFFPILVDKVGLQQVVAGIATPARRVAPAQPVGRTVGGHVLPVSPSYELDPNEGSGNSSLSKFGIYVLIVAVIGIIGYMIYYNSRNQLVQEQQAQPDTMSATDPSKNASDTVLRSMEVPVDSTTRTTATAPKPASATAASLPPARGSSLAAELTRYVADTTAPKGRTFPLSAVAFEPGSTSLTTGSVPVVNEIASFLKANPAAQIRLVGYANDAEGNLTNKSLSFKRVNVIKAMLVAQGIDYIRVDAIGLGTGNKAKPGDSTATRQPGLRKIDLKVVYK